jgi:ribosomal protein L7Ae-like RNA K-turn-binding protein
MKEVNLNQKSISLIGFAIKSGKTVSGFEAVRREIEKNKLNGVLIDSNLSKNSIKKLQLYLNKKKIPYFKNSDDTNWKKIWGVATHKIIGFKKSSISLEIVEKFKLGV